MSNKMNAGKILDTCTYAISCTGLAAFFANSMQWIQANSGAIMAIIAIITYLSSQIWKMLEYLKSKKESELRMLEIQSRIDLRKLEEKEEV